MEAGGDEDGTGRKGTEEGGRGVEFLIQEFIIGQNLFRDVNDRCCEVFRG